MKLSLKLNWKPLYNKRAQKLLYPEFWSYLYCNEFYKIVCDMGLGSYKALELVDQAFYLAKISQEKYSGKITERVWLLGFLHSQIEEYYSQNSIDN